MANVYRSGSIYVDSTGVVVTRRVKVAYIIFTPAAINDTMTIRDGDGAGDPLKLTLKGDIANHSTQFDFSNSPLLFEEGIYCSVLTAGALVTFILTSEGATS
jgi:hypothetical protein